MARILIKNGRIWDGTRFFDGDVFIDGDIVARIGANLCNEADFIYDATGKIVSAGLVDLHAHLLVDERDKYGMQAESCCFPFGVTAAADAGRFHGNSATMARFFLKNVAFVSTDISNGDVDFEAIDDALERFADRAVGIKICFDSTQTNVKSASVVKEICDFATKRNLRVMVHCTNCPVEMSELLSVLRSGDILTHAFQGSVNNISCDNYHSLKSAQARGVVIDTGFAGHVHTDFSVLRGAVANGVVPDTISTDITRFSAFTRGGKYGMTMCMSIAKFVGLSEVDIFRSVTSNPARILGKADEWGNLSEGRCADIAVIDFADEGFDLTDKAGHNIKSGVGYRCVLAIANGQVVYRK